MKFTTITKNLPPMRRGPYYLEPIQRRFVFHGQEVKLTPVQVLLVRAMLEQPNLNTTAMWQKVWGTPPPADDFTWRNIVQVHMHFLRNKLGDVVVRGGTVREVTWRLQ